MDDGEYTNEMIFVEGDIDLDVKCDQVWNEPVGGRPVGVYKKGERYYMIALNE